jgi:DMSO reductase anchor subunit
LHLYPWLFGLRFFVMVAGFIVFAFAFLWSIRRQKVFSSLLVPIYVTFLLVMVGEILGRFLFYASHVRLGL